MGPVLSILISMLTSVPMGLGLGPKVMLEVLMVPDLTALITALERLATFAIGEMLEVAEVKVSDW